MFDPIRVNEREPYPILCSLSTKSLTLILTSLSVMSLRRRWAVGSNRVPIDDSDWDVISSALSTAIEELSVSILLGVVIHSLIPLSEPEFLLCDGSSFNRVDYPQLYAVLPSALIDDADTFHTPDLILSFMRGNLASLGTGGAETHTLSIAELPSHNHSYGYPSVGVDVEAPGVPDFTAVGNPPQTLATGSTGDGESHNNLPPFTDGIPYLVAR
jgi:microcystin-dependent protein